MLLSSNILIPYLEDLDFRRCYILIILENVYFLLLSYESHGMRQKSTWHIWVKPTLKKTVASTLELTWARENVGKETMKQMDAVSLKVLKVI